MKGIKHIFFDLDHTLWDYDRSAKETLEEIYERFELSKSGTSPKKLIKTFYNINDGLWRKYNEGKIDREYIKRERFKGILQSIDHDATLAPQVSEYFITNCSSKPYLMPEAYTALCYLTEKYELHIITNGFKDIQNRKLTNSGISKFFNVVVTSECTNARKPSGEIFNYSLELAGAIKENSLMIGDNPRADIQGAREYGIKTVHYDPSGKRRALADHTIQSHSELLKLL